MVNVTEMGSQLLKVFVNAIAMKVKLLKFKRKLLNYMFRGWQPCSMGIAAGLNQAYTECAHGLRLCFNLMS